MRSLKECYWLSPNQKILVNRSTSNDQIWNPSLIFNWFINNYIGIGSHCSTETSYYIKQFNRNDINLTLDMFPQQMMPRHIINQNKTLKDAPVHLAANIQEGTAPIILMVISVSVWWFKYSPPIECRPFERVATPLSLPNI